MIVKDTVVLIHLAKLGILEKTCDLFKQVYIPKLVEQEAIKENKYPDAKLIQEAISTKKIIVKKIINDKLIKKANSYNIQKGEAEVVALYWQENADLIATDDNNVRKKRLMLNLNIIGTPLILLKLYQKNIITKKDYLIKIIELSKIGWFSSTIIDKLKMEV